MSTVEITLKGLFLVVPTGNGFTILLPKSPGHAHREPTVDNESIEGVDIDLTSDLPHGTVSNVPPRSTIPIGTLSGDRPVKPHLLQAPFPTNDLKARIRIPKSMDVDRIGNALWDVEGTLVFASNELEFVYENAPSAITVRTKSGQKTISERAGVVRIPFVHRAVVEPQCGARVLAHHVDAYYDLIHEPSGRPIPELLDACPAAAPSLALSPEIVRALPTSEEFIDLKNRYNAAVGELAESMSTFTCLVGSG